MALDATTLKGLLRDIDGNLSAPTRICLIGSGATILLGQTARQTDDIDIWAVASDFTFDLLQDAVEKAGIAFDPTEIFPKSPYVQLVQPGIVQVPGWNRAKREWLGESERVAWQGNWLAVTVPPGHAIVASKMIRGDDRDFEDCLWLIAYQRLEAKVIRQAIRALPSAARIIAQDNFSILVMMQP